jgi:hypothetical protein
VLREKTSGENQKLQGSRLRKRNEGGGAPQHKQNRRRCSGRKNLACPWKKPGVRALVSGGAGTWHGVAARKPSDWRPNGAKKKIEWGRRLARGGAVRKRRHTGADKKIEQP